MNRYTGVEIAVIGMSGQFPGADNIQEFWDNLRNGKESISHFENQELIEAGIDKSLLNNPLYIKANAFLTNKEYFDADFFGYLPDEAKLMDPQMRLFHENCWKALEDAGYNVESNTEKIGLFAGGSPNTNWVSHSYLSNLDTSVNNFSAFHLRDITFLCSRVSYLMNLQGPSIYINTACSTSLVALQRACMSLLLRECKMALAGGVTVTNYAQAGYLHQEGMIFSKDGHCRAFDENASGTVGGEGVGVVLLKRLQEAIADGDPIYAVIKGSGINNDGSDKMAYTAPGVEGQRQAILKAINMAKVEPESITYVEAHGTGTRLGDPVEIEALNSAFGNSSTRYCALGSVKTNIGHLDAAAGIAGFIKTVLALWHRQIPPSLHFSKANEAINFNNSPFFVNTALTPWKNDRHPLRAGVSSFGIGGTNVHVVLEEAPLPEVSSAVREHQLLVISGKTANAVERNKANLLTWLKANQEVNLADAAYTLQTGRIAFAYRDAIVCANREEAISLLEQATGRISGLAENRMSGAAEMGMALGGTPAVAERGTALEGTPVGAAMGTSLVGTPLVAFMFSGQGSQYAGMCHNLYEQEEIFRQEADQCFAIVKQLSGLDIKEVLFSQEGKSGQDINETANTQPALFIIEYALAKLLIHWGIQPGIMIGHSIGEYVAACLGGVFSLEDALRLVVRRGELMQSVPAGKMLAISIPEEDLLSYLAEWQSISLAAVNSTELCVVSGKEEDIALFKTVMEGTGRPCRVIRTSHAFHSHMMEGVLDAFEAEVRLIKLNRPHLPFISNVSGGRVSDNEVTDPRYWVRHLRQAVKFSEGVTNILESNEQVVFVEVGPGRALCSMVQSNKDKGPAHKTVSLVRQGGVAGNDLQHLLSGLGQLWVNGIVPDWKTFYAGEKRRKISLPSYSFEKTSYPVLVDAFKMIMDKSVNGPKKPSSWFYIPAWKQVPLLPRAAEVGKEKRLLLFIDEEGIGDDIVRKYTLDGVAVVVVKAGIRFKKVSAALYELDPGKEEDYRSLFTSLSESGGIPYKVIHGWSVGIKNVPGWSVGTDAGASEDFHSLLYLVRALSQIGKMTERMIVLLTNDLHTITGEEKKIPGKAVALGLLKVIPQEYPTISTSHIDISLAAGKEGLNTVRLCQEIDNITPGAVVGLRRQQRLVQIYDEIEPQPVNTTIRQPIDTPIKKKGVYLITGGLGNLGYHISRHLLNTYEARVILTGRTDLSAGSAVEKALRLKQLDALPGEVLYLQADISDRMAFGKVVEAAEARFGAIQGIVHAAGIVDGKSINPISQLTPDDFDCQFSAKVEGLTILRDLFGEKELDFCLIASSLSSVLGGLGFASYASANTFMDHYISFYKGQGQLENWVCVNFDGLDFDESNIHPENIHPWEIWPVIEKLLSFTLLGNVCVSKTDLHKRLGDWIHRKSPSNDPSNMANDPSSMVNDPSIADPAAILSQGAGSSVDTEQTMILLWKAFFGKSSIGGGADFFEMGGDSLKALTMIGRIYKTFHTEVSVSEFFKRSTIKGLSDYIDSVRQSKTAFVELPNLSIAPAAIKEYYPLSSVQRRLYFLHVLNRSSLVYNIPQILKLKGVLNRERLLTSFHQLIERHESLRTYFDLINDEPVQKLQQVLTPDIEYYLVEEKETAAAIEAFIRPFDLYRAPLLRMGILQTGADEYLLLTDMHHIITDGVSFDVLIRDFMAFYTNETLLPLRLQYKDYAEWQQGKEGQSLIRQHQSFWLQEFEAPVIALDLPGDFVRPPVKTFAGNIIDFTLGTKETEKLKALATQEGATLFMVLLSVYGVLLGRLSNQEDIVIGTPSSGRPHADLESIIGMFVNTLCLRSYPRGGLSFLDYLKEIKSKALACFDHQGYQYENLIEDLKVKRDPSRNPLFETMFIFRNFGLTELNIPGLSVKSHPIEQNISKFDLSLSATEQDGRLLFNIEYSTDLFKPETIQRFISYFKKVVGTVSDNPAIHLKDIDLLSEDEKHRLLHLFNDTRVPYPEEATVISLFEKQAATIPDHIAVVDGERSITYEQLNSWANKIAGQIKDKIRGSNQTLGLLFTPCAGMIAGMLAILKSGCAYTPLSPNAPDERNNYILSDCNAALLLGGQASLQEHPDIVTAIGNDRVLMVEDSPISSERCRNDRRKVSPGSLLYIIYTSGSTGKPKGVEVENSGILNMLHFYKHLFDVKEGVPMSQVANVSFDAAAFEIWPCLTHGACLHIAPPDARVNPESMKAWLTEKKIQISFQLPAIAEYLLKMEWDAQKTSLKILNVAGDRFNHSLSRQFPFRLFNLYGPTEDSIWTTYAEMNYNQRSNYYSIGKPIANKSIYILDKYHQLQPMGVPGELCIAGAGIARGYVNSPELTKEKFVDNPYMPGEKMYKSGDYGRWAEDGNIEFFGRIDNQVKIRGFRIEPGEIERQLSKHPQVNEVAVIPVEQQGDKYLVAYYTSNEPTMSSNLLKEFLLGSVADYMVPSFFVQLDTMPVNSNGKINRNNLPVIDIWNREDHVAPSSDIEEGLAAIWSEILTLDKTAISADKGFFELGGHSLKAAVLVNKIAREFDIKISLQDIFSIDTIIKQADYIENEKWLLKKDQRQTSIDESISEEFIID